jgi:hypothetical protein
VAVQVPAIPTGPVLYRPVTAVPPVAPVKSEPSEGADGGVKLRASQPPGVGSLLDAEA